MLIRTNIYQLADRGSLTGQPAVDRQEIFSFAGGALKILAGLISVADKKHQRIRRQSVYN